MAPGISVGTWRFEKQHLQPYYFFNQSSYANKDGNKNTLNIVKWCVSLSLSYLWVVLSMGPQDKAHELGHFTQLLLSYLLFHRCMCQDSFPSQRRSHTSLTYVYVNIIIQHIYDTWLYNSSFILDNNRNKLNLILPCYFYHYYLKYNLRGDFKQASEMSILLLTSAPLFIFKQLFCVPICCPSRIFSDWKEHKESILKLLQVITWTMY